VIELRDIAKTYGRHTSAVHALRGVSLQIEEGEALAILGPSGSGKTTLLDVIGALSHPTGGTYLCRGRDVFHMSQAQLARLRNEQFGFVFQSFNLLSAVRVDRNVALPLRYSRLSRKDRAGRVEKALENVALGHKIHSLANELSGGEQQRVAIARAIVADPAAILADEPTGNLDSLTGNSIIDLLFDLRKRQGKTILVVTHNETLAARFPRILRILDGRIVFDGPPEGEGV
jgi:putative ABC transport system ATP-binding protein